MLLRYYTLCIVVLVLYDRIQGTFITALNWLDSVEQSFTSIQYWVFCFVLSNDARKNFNASRTFMFQAQVALDCLAPGLLY